MADAMTKTLRHELVRLEDITEADVQSYYQRHRDEFKQDFSQERAHVRNRLFELRRDKALADYLKDLRKSAKIEINEQRLAGLAASERQPGAPPAAQRPKQSGSGGR
jgi:hypothetical protein